MSRLKPLADHSPEHRQVLDVRRHRVGVVGVDVLREHDRSSSSGLGSRPSDQTVGEAPLGSLGGTESHVDLEVARRRAVASGRRHWYRSASAG
jgi:hypothetical protein